LLRLRRLQRRPRSRKQRPGRRKGEGETIRRMGENDGIVDGVDLVDEFRCADGVHRDHFVHRVHCLRARLTT
jgi:hypothetical protein